MAVWRVVRECKQDPHFLFNKLLVYQRLAAWQTVYHGSPGREIL